MSLVKSISGIRGTIGGAQGDGLSPVDIVKFATGYALWLKKNVAKSCPRVVVGRDARLSGPMMERLVIGTLLSTGCDVVNIGMATTPTTEMAVVDNSADGGIIITASHNPRHWNALKLLNNRGEFLNKQEGEEMLRLSDEQNVSYCTVDELGKETCDAEALQRHIRAVLELPLVDIEAIRKADFKVAVDAVNSIGGKAIPQLLAALGVTRVECLNCDPTGEFAHNPEPIPENLTQISDLIREHGADLGIVVDPDVDRLALICENGEMFGEEYTLVSVADYVLSHKKGNTVSNLSSTRALADITVAHGGEYAAAAVGEVNVVEKMKATNAVIGGEGNGGVIYPALHYGRDALVGVALFLSHLAHKKCSMSELRATYPNYYISKNKIELTPAIDVDGVLAVIKGCYKQFKITDIDGVKIDFPQGWVHLRKSNTEPIIRIYSEAPTAEQADAFAAAIMAEIKRIANI